MNSSRLQGPADAPIGVFDSGVGGLSIVRELLKLLPDESLFYIGDQANCPYGNRPAEEIVAFSREISRYLIARGAKVIVVACNTVSAVALAHLRSLFPETPFVGMVPAVKPAVQITRSGVVGVLATPTTIAGRLYQEVVKQCAVGKRVISQPSPGLVDQVEAGDLDGPETMALLERYIKPLLDAGADTLVLGCSHYPFLIPAIRRLVGDAVQLVDASEAIARQTARILEREGLRRQESVLPEAIYATTGAPERMQFALERLLGRPGRVHALHWVNGRVVDGYPGEEQLELCLHGHSAGAVKAP
jgi:glutamate racemase